MKGGVDPHGLLLRKYVIGTYTDIDDDTSYVRRFRASKNPTQCYTALRKTETIRFVFTTGFRLRNVVITNRLNRVEISFAIIRSFVRFRRMNDVK